MGLGGFGTGHNIHKSFDPVTLFASPCHQVARADGQSSPALVDPQAPTKGTSMAQYKPKRPHSSSEHLLDDILAEVDMVKLLT